VLASAGVCPRRSRALEQPAQRLIAEPLACLNDRAWRHPNATAARQREVKCRHQVAHRQIAEQTHADDEPHDLLGRQSPSPNGRGAGRGERLIDPLGIEARDKLRQQVCTQRLDDAGGGAWHARILIVRIFRNKASGQQPEFRSNVRGLPLTDRHWY
jgi:hypothetical protein